MSLKFKKISDKSSEIKLLNQYLINLSLNEFEVDFDQIFNFFSQYSNSFQENLMKTCKAFAYSKHSFKR